jgi:RNA 3'-terminal phosphate cyclase
LVRRGHYPRGGGEVVLTVRPSELRAVDTVEFGNLVEIRGLLMGPSRKTRLVNPSPSGSSTNLSNSSPNLNNSIGKPTKTTKPNKKEEKF